MTIPRGRHTGYIPAERVHATWASSNTTMGLICSPYETSSLYFLSRPLLSGPDLSTVCNDFRLFCKQEKIHLKEHYLSPAIKSFLCPSAAQAPLCSCSGFPLVPAASLAKKTAKLRTQPFLLFGSLISIQEQGSQKIPEGLL